MARTRQRRHDMATGETGFADVTYDLVAVQYHALKAGHDYGQYVRDAENAGLNDIAQFFRDTMKEDSARAARAGAVLLHRVAEELRDVVQPGVLRVPDVLAVIVPRLEGVVLDGDEIVGNVREAGLSGGHVVPPLSRASHRRYPFRGVET